jgi:hypothetical protein
VPHQKKEVKIWEEEKAAALGPLTTEALANKARPIRAVADTAKMVKGNKIDGIMRKGDRRTIGIIRAITDTKTHMTTLGRADFADRQ